MVEENTSVFEAKEYYNKGLIAFEKKNYAYAIELFSQALVLKKDFSDARYYLRLSEQRRLKENPPAPLSAILNKITSLPILLQALLFDIQNKPEQAIYKYEKILRLQPNNNYILIRLGQDLLKERDAQSALKVFESIRQISPKNVEALKNLGRLYGQMDNYAAARQCYQEVLNILPHDSEAEKGLKNLDALGAIKDNFGQPEQN